MNKKKIIKRVIISFLFLLLLLNYYFADVFKPKTDYAIDGCDPDNLPVKNFWAGEDETGKNKTDVTFIAFGDTQIFLDISLFKKQNRQDGGRKNDVYKLPLNEAERVNWNSLGVEQCVSNIRGIIMAGDITQNGRDGRMGSENEYGLFTGIYGLCGNRQIKYHIYEGYGNHDYFEWNNIGYRIPKAHPVADSVSVRNPYRAGVVNMAPDKDGHYSWEWDNLHFIQLNLCPSDVKPKLKVPKLRDPRNALTFLKNDLEKFVKNTSKKVVLIAHYGPRGDFEFTKEQIKDFYEVIKCYPIIAYIHGHYHNTSFYYWKGIPIFNVGSPYSWRSYSGSYAVFRITDNYIYAMDVGFDRKKPKNLKFPYKWKQKIDITKIKIKK